MSTERKGAFRVLIAGGGVAGLTLANALEQAGIDYLLLEKRDIAPRMGAYIGVLCHTARVFDQLGVWNRMRDASLGLTGRQHFDEHGRLFEDSGVFKFITGKTKRPFLFLERHFYLQYLYDKLKDKSKIRTRCGVQALTETDGGVAVTTDAGEEIHGSILLGADGIHSTIRQIISDADNPRFTAHYRTLFATSHNHFADDPSRCFLPESMVHNVYYRRSSGVAAVGAPDRVFWLLFVKIDSPATMPNFPQYTEADIEATLRQYGDRSIGAGYTFNDLWASPIGGGMVPMEEGVVDAAWHNKGGCNSLLTATASEKSTINVGLGGNTAVEGVATFMNLLVPLLARNPKPSHSDVPRARACVTLSHYVTRFEAMDTWWLRMLRWLSPWFPDSVKAKAFLDFMKPAPILNFLPDPDRSKA
ncbi:FAD/NAD(P)-binding domain-containing protein [Achaetomium macrosporum]|uniref:FAD/NAD(P)-binding domain-containing protein n=1 Tax=Achaetomium macrosporum TaxID=79813 RepID=A0AAN7C4R5_9PEZI|nr:FAD/NAD(P)-binding domain-containing protein [Achaetomium macrosporum]